MELFERILAARGLDDSAKRAAFLSPKYEARHDPFLLPDMAAAVERLAVAHDKQERITIYGDYDIDGLTATTVLLDSLEAFGFKHVAAFIPNRFVEGYGMTVEAVDKIAAAGCDLILTVDCGSLSHEPIAHAKELGIDVIVTDHHNVAQEQPAAVAVINPKRLLQDFPERYKEFILIGGSSSSFPNATGFRHDNLASASLDSAELPTGQRVKQSSNRQESVSKSSGKTRALGKSADDPARLYPFLDLPGVGVAFKLVQALQTQLDGLKTGQEKWLLDLVALGTVCDVVTLLDENRMHVYWGLEVMKKTRRPGLKALMAVAGVEQQKVNARSLGFALGPRMNAAGRLETAQIALDMLRATSKDEALEKAQQLDEMNVQRRNEQDKILKAALVEAEKYADDPVLVVSGKDWNHGIIGIVAARLLETFHKPTFVLQEDVNAQHEAAAELQGEGQDSEFTSESQRRGEPLLSKGSARSYGDFSAADAIRASDGIITKGGGHKLAAGVTLPTANIAAFRQRVNDFYISKELSFAQEREKLLPVADVSAMLVDIDEPLIELLSQLEPYGNGNSQPIFLSENTLVKMVRRMGAEGQHVRLHVDDGRSSLELVAFSAPEHFFVEPGVRVKIWYQPEINEWQGRRSVQGRLLHLELE